jgi:hypothetical protein
MLKSSDFKAMIWLMINSGVSKIHFSSMEYNFLQIRVVLTEGARKTLTWAIFFNLNQIFLIFFLKDCWISISLDYKFQLFLSANLKNLQRKQYFFAYCGFDSINNICLKYHSIYMKIDVFYKGYLLKKKLLNSALPLKSYKKVLNHQ